MWSKSALRVVRWGVWSKSAFRVEWCGVWRSSAEQQCGPEWSEVEQERVQSSEVWSVESRVQTKVERRGARARSE